MKEGNIWLVGGEVREHKYIWAEIEKETNATISIINACCAGIEFEVLINVSLLSHLFLLS